MSKREEHSDKLKRIVDYIKSELGDGTEFIAVTKFGEDSVMFGSASRITRLDLLSSAVSQLIGDSTMEDLMSDVKKILDKGKEDRISDEDDFTDHVNFNKEKRENGLLDYVRDSLRKKK